MGKGAITGLFYTCFVTGTALLAGATVAASYAGRFHPAESFVMPLLGLALPFLLVACLLVAFGWWLRRSWWTLLPLAAFFASWNYLTTIFRWPYSEKVQVESAQRLKVATYNVAHFGGEITGYSCREIARMMEEEGVDVLCLQECGSSPSFPMDSVRQAFSHWPYALFPTLESEENLLTMAVLSLYPLAGDTLITFEGTANCSMMCDVLCGEDTLRLFNSHLQTTSVSQNRKKWERELMADDSRRETKAVKDAAETLHGNLLKRAAQADSLAACIRQSPYPVLFCGDLNSLPSSYTYYRISSLLEDGFRTAGHGYMYTYRNAKRLLRIDYAFHSAELTAVDYRSPGWKLCSDHNPVLLEVALPQTEMPLEQEEK